MYKLRDWIDINRLDLFELSLNPNAIHILEKNVDKINWYWLSMNSNAIDLLEKNVDKIDWRGLSSNPNAMILLENNVDKIYWHWLSMNRNAIHLLEKKNAYHKIDLYELSINWYELSKNPSIFELDYEALEKRCNIYKEELIKKALHPSVITRYLNHPDLKDKDLEYILDNCF